MDDGGLTPLNVNLYPGPPSAIRSQHRLHQTQGRGASSPDTCQKLLKQVFTLVEVPCLTPFHSFSARSSQMFVYQRMK